MPSSWGKIFRVSTFGESHGKAVGVVVDGVPAGMPIQLDLIQSDLTRRRPGQSKLTTPRKEADAVQILSGVFEGRSIGSPIAMLVENQNQRSTDYDNMKHVYRPSHADYTYQEKYGYRSHVGGARASVRETIGRVAAAAIARDILGQELGIQTIAWVESVADVDAKLMQNPPRTIDEVDGDEVRCPNDQAAEQMRTIIEQARDAGDSVGGIVGIAVYNVPPGLGDPVYDKLEADFAKALLSIPACKGFEIGSGFAGTQLHGSQHNDEFYMEGERVRTRSNYSGGVQGGISNGETILMRAAFKPTSTIFKEQRTVNDRNEDTVLAARGRHDPCVLPRAVPIVEAVVNLVLMDAYLYQRAIQPQWYEKWKKNP